MKKEKIFEWVVIFYSIALLLNTYTLFNARIFKVQIQGGEISSSNSTIDYTAGDSENEKWEIDEEKSNSELTYYKVKPRSYTIGWSVWLESVDEVQVYNIVELGARIYKDKSFEEPLKIKRIHL